MVDVGVGVRARVTLLDGFGVQLGAGGSRSALEELPHGVQRLVAHLCLSGRPPRSTIAGQLWPEVPEDHAHGSLRSALWRLQKAAPGLVAVSAGRLRSEEHTSVIPSRQYVVCRLLLEKKQSGCS